MALNKDHEVYATLVGGMLAGPVEALSLMPVDVAKTRLQLGMGPKKLVPLIKHIISEEGVGALWKGCGVFATHLTVKYFVRWGCAGQLSEAFKPKDGGKMTSGRRLAAGSTAGLLESIFIVTPFEVVKTRIQQQKGKADLLYTGPVQATFRIVREEGITAMWKGVTSTSLRNMGNMGANLVFKPIFDEHIWGHKSTDKKRLPIWKTLITGGFAGCMGPLFNMPLDVAKTRMMAQRTVAGQAPKYTNTFQCMKVVASEEGLMMLWKGYFPRVARVGPGFAIQWAVIDTTKKLWPNFFPNSLA
eukprot:NODE_4311_length_1189_cov_76.064728_g3806_i0.p1 GENE.NODE_4311_length_1189_cov_76.064728_g3806_i0~~NODE_4311_length_1189_cov_76.064728_g3806_i0.p1  ORF type:complete len:320 (+),score=90.69 NODE_4311_length_1189_cov_76.064728_g3806_i0:58-960(+)